MFIRPHLPPNFILVSADVADADVEQQTDGPFAADDAHSEDDNAIVFMEDGCLPFRLGVREQAGDVLTLHDGSLIRVVPWPLPGPATAFALPSWWRSGAFERPGSRVFLVLDLPATFCLEVFDAAAKAWFDCGWLDRDWLLREADGSYVCAGHGGSPLFLRCVEREGDMLLCLDGGGYTVIYKLLPAD